MKIVFLRDKTTIYKVPSKKLKILTDLNCEVNRINQEVHIVLLTENALQLDIFSTTYFVFDFRVKTVSDSV